MIPCQPEWLCVTTLVATTTAVRKNRGTITQSHKRGKHKNERRTFLVAAKSASGCWVASNNHLNAPLSAWLQPIPMPPATAAVLDITPGSYTNCRAIVTGTWWRNTINGNSGYGIPTCQLHAFKNPRHSVHTPVYGCLP
jgi:hypothetical protein